MINDRIRYPQVRVVDDQNAQIGVLPTREAIDMARDRGLDLVLVAPQAQPPVCKIISWGKHKYELSKRKVKPKSSDLKMVRLHPRTGVHDRDILIRNAERFLRDGHKVRVVCQFKGRENAYPELGRKQMDAISGALEEISNVEGAIVKQGRDMTMMITPKPGVKPLPKVSKGDALAQKLAEEEAAKEQAAFEASQAELAAEADPEAEASVDEDESDDADLEDVEGAEGVDVGETVVDESETDDSGAETEK